jgi:hypothetical protein
LNRDKSNARINIDGLFLEQGKLDLYDTNIITKPIIENAISYSVENKVLFSTRFHGEEMVKSREFPRHNSEKSKKYWMGVLDLKNTNPGKHVFYRPRPPPCGTPRSSTPLSVEAK